jgi:hypothetical protein
MTEAYSFSRRQAIGRSQSEFIEDLPSTFMMAYPTNRDTWKQSLLFVCLLGTATLSAQTSKVLQAAGEIHLARFGYADATLASRNHIDSPLRHVLAFDRGGSVIAGFASRERDGLVTRSSPAFSFHVVKIDPVTGTEISTTSITTSDWKGNSLFVTAGDRILVKADDSLTLLSEDFRTAATKSVDHERGSLWSLLESRDKKVVLVVMDLIGRTRVESINPETLETRESCEYPLGTGQIMDVNVMGVAAVFNGQGSVRNVFLRPICGMPKLVLSWSGELEDPSFLSVGILLLSGFSRSLQVVTTDGRTLFQDKFGSHDVVDSYVKASIQADKFAISIRTKKGGSSFLDVASHLSRLKIMIYDLQAQKRIAEISLPHTPKYYFDFDFSPDGKTLAVMCDEVIQLYNLR